MKVRGEIFSFQKEGKEAEEVRYQKYLNFQVKKTVSGQNPGKLYIKRTDLEGIAITYEGVNEYGRTHKHK